MSLKGTTQSFSILRGEGEEAELEGYDLELDEGMVVLDCLHRIQHEQEPDMAVRWNCKAGKCGSCSAEINGRPRLMCMTRMSDVVAETPAGQPIEIRPMKTFPHVKDLVTDVSWNYEVAQRIAPINGPEAMDWEFNQMEPTECSISVNASNVSSASTRATSFETTPCSMISPALVSLCDWLNTKCTPLTPKTVFQKSRRNSVLSTATSLDAAPKSAPQASKSPMTPSSNSKSVWSTDTTIPCSAFGGPLRERTSVIELTLAAVNGR